MKGLLALLAPAFALGAQYSAQQYRTGEVHQKIMNTKHASWARQRAEGQMNSTQYPALANPVKCENGLAVVEAGNANQTFRCNNMDLLDFRSHADLGSFGGEGSSSWGWVSPDGREFAAIGQQDGTAFAEITPEGKLVYLGRLPQQSVFSIWREIRSYKDYLIIGSEAVGHGVQIFEWSKLLNLDPANPTNFSTTTDVTAVFNDLPVGRTHNVLSGPAEKDYFVVVGAQPRNSTCRAGLIFVDMTDPTKPTSPGCAGQDGYVHDAQCVIYHGPDTRYEGKEICYGYNEDTLTIYDVTNKQGVNSTKVISKLSYPGASYTHQGWVLDLDYQDYIVLDDELDEEDRAGPAADGYPVTYIIDITNLEAPKQTGLYKSKGYSIDHNQYVIDGLSYQSNYGAGIRVLDVSSIRDDPTGAGVEEVAFFDIYPEDDAQPNGGVIDFVGTWSHYAYYPSGNILVNTIERGAFVVKMTGQEGRARGRNFKKPRAVRS